MIKTTGFRLAGLAVITAVGLMGLPGTSQASMTTFKLANHPDGSEAPPEYGMRLDGLYTGDGSDVWTFDFEHADSSMWLKYDGTSVNIFGDVYGGLNSGSGYDSTLAGVWTVDFNYTTNVSSTSSGDDFAIEIGAEDSANTGTIQAGFSGSSGGISIGSGDILNLADEEGDFGYSFRFNNTADHRLDGTGLGGPDTFVGWGWMNHGITPGSEPASHIKASDWLFTGTRVSVPTPGTLLLFAVGLVALTLSAMRSRSPALRASR